MSRPPRMRRPGGSLQHAGYRLKGPPVQRTRSESAKAINMESSSVALVRGKAVGRESSIASAHPAVAHHLCDDGRRRDTQRASFTFRHAHLRQLEAIQCEMIDQDRLRGRTEPPDSGLEGLAVGGSEAAPIHDVVCCPADSDGYRNFADGAERLGSLPWRQLLRITDGAKSLREGRV